MLNGKVAVVTGGSRGIGAAAVRELAAKGADVAVIYAGNQELADKECQECRERYGVRAGSYCCDVADFEAAKEAVAKIKEDFGKVDILVNNAGITRDKLLLMMKEEDFDAVLGVNLKGAFNMIRHVSSLFIRNKGGKIINVSSVVGLHGNAGQANYAASKAGIIGLTKSVAKELAGKNILCNAVAPGFIETDMTKSLSGAEEAWLNRIPLKRAGKAEEVAKAVVVLAESDYITGEVLRVDGGMGM